MLDADKINDGYDDVLNNGVTVSMFKRKANVQEYFNGYVGYVRKGNSSKYYSEDFEKSLGIYRK